MDDDFQISLRAPSRDGLGQTRADVPLQSPQLDDEVAVFRAAVLHEGVRVDIPRGGLLIGHSSDCGLQLQSSLVSPHHARLDARHGRAELTDLGSSVGLYVNGEHLPPGSHVAIQSGDGIGIGDAVLYFVTTDSPPLPPIEVPLPESRLQMDRPEVSIGSDSGNDVVLDHPLVSPHHAQIVTGQSGIRIKDLSRGGDGLRVNGNLVHRAFLKTGDEIAIGPYRLIFDGQLLQQRSVGHGMRLEAEAVRMDAGAKTILRPATITVQPGELVAIIGPSGAGKSTLLKSLCGVYSITGGRVTVDGDPVRSRQTDLGYVPQDEIVHPLLSVREAMQFAAELRLPHDATDLERQAAVNRVIAEVGLDAHADTRIGALSGGQRKRVGVATELISQPGMLFLDEPTTGLDPGLEQRMMELFQSLANSGRATLVVTHATRSLRLCEKVIVMGEGGHLCFMGTPDDALDFFAVEHFDDLYPALDRQPAADWAEAFARTRRYTPPAGVSSPSAGPARPRRPLGPQTTVLIRRRLVVLSRDRRNLAILAGQVPVIALLLALLFHHGVFRHVWPAMPSPAVRVIEAQAPGETAQLLFLLVTVALWFGCLASAREIVKERAVMEREAAVGVRIESYLLSKGFVLGVLTGLQTLVMAGIVLGMRPLHDPGVVTGVVIGVLVLTAWAGVAMGLLVSIAVRTEDQAASFVPLLLIPQLLFGGSLMPVHQMGVVLQVLSKVVVSQWSFAGLGNAVHMNQRIAQDPPFSAGGNHFGHSFFAIPAVASVLVIVAFIALCGVTLFTGLTRQVTTRR
jgi:ABC-type multidrug transport system ATPase subunit/pSer/pThr/pTyr-binding forkhead associated (FHA) protein